MIKESIIRYKRILREIRSGKILNRIGSGKIVYFENPFDKIALKYIPGGPGKFGKYFAKYHGMDEFEIDFNSSYVLMAALEGRQISKARYDNYHLIEGSFWDKNINNSRNESDYRYLVHG